MIDPSTSPPIDTATGQPVGKCRERVDLLVATLSKRGSKLVIPTPALAEALVRTGISASVYLQMFRGFSVFQIADFDQRAAIETATIMGQHWGGRLADLRATVSRHKIKFDLQILAISKVAGATEILSDDPGVKAVATLLAMPCRGIADLPPPPEPAQPDLFSA